MSNRTDFEVLAGELVEMFGLDPEAELEGTGKLLWRLERELHNAFVAESPSTIRLGASHERNRRARRTAKAAGTVS